VLSPAAPALAWAFPGIKQFIQEGTPDQSNSMSLIIGAPPFNMHRDHSRRVGLEASTSTIPGRNHRTNPVLAQPLPNPAGIIPPISRQVRRTAPWSTAWLADLDQIDHCFERSAAIDSKPPVGGVCHRVGFVRQNLAALAGRPRGQWMRVGHRSR